MKTKLDLPNVENPKVLPTLSTNTLRCNCKIHYSQIPVGRETNNMLISAKQIEYKESKT